MKKLVRIISVLCLAAMMFTFAACGGDAPAEPTPAQPGTTENVGAPSASGSKYVFSYYGTPIAVGSEMAPILSAVGEPLSYFEAESCAFEGLDKTYTYVDFVVITYPDGETDRVSTVRLTADTVSTAEGVEIGNTLSDVVAAYGENYVQDVNSYTYTDGNTKLMFILENDVVTSITYAMV